MKRFLVFLLVLVLVFTLVACGGKNEPKKQDEGKTPVDQGKDNKKDQDQKKDEKKDDKAAELKKIEKLSVYFVPSKEPDEIITATEPLKGLLVEEMKKHGYDLQKVDIQVGSSYEAVGEAMEAGSADIGFIPGGTYVLYRDGGQLDVILTATRAGLSKDSANAKDWNDGKATEKMKDKQVTFYLGLIVAGPSEKGQALLAKVNAGEKLTQEDLKDVNWAYRSPTSSSGYIYPSMYLKETYGVNLSEMPHAVEADSYGSAMARLAEETVDVITIYADARMDYAEKWKSEFNREKSIWEETGVVGVTAPIYNDTISVSNASPIMDDKFKAALQDAFIEIAKTDAGKAAIKIYSHEGYQKAKAADYDKEAEVQKILKQSN